MTRRLLVINPNTSQSITDLLQQHVRAHAGAGIEVRAVTARFGAPYIADEASCAVAGHAVLDAWQAGIAHGDAAHAVLIGCFGDPGLFALREVSPVPVIGLAEAAFAQARRHGRFAVVTGGQRWAPILLRLAQSLGYAEALIEVQTIAESGAELAADTAAAHALLLHACRVAARLPGVQAVVVGGAGLAGLAPAIAPHLPLPLIDSVRAGAWMAADHARGNAAPAFPLP